MTQIDFSQSIPHHRPPRGQRAPEGPEARPGPRKRDDYEQMWALAHASGSRPACVRAMDESYIFTRLLQGRVPAELVDALRVRCPDAFRARAAMVPPTSPSERRTCIEAFIAAWHRANNLPVPVFSAHAACTNLAEVPQNDTF